MSVKSLLSRESMQRCLWNCLWKYTNCYFHRQVCQKILFLPYVEDVQWLGTWNHTAPSISWLRKPKVKCKSKRSPTPMIISSKNETIPILVDKTKMLRTLNIFHFFHHNRSPSHCLHDHCSRNWECWSSVSIFHRSNIWNHSRGSLRTLKSCWNRWLSSSWWYLNRFRRFTKRIPAFNRKCKAWSLLTREAPHRGHNNLGPSWDNPL